jgi:SsrA-binding protein
MNPVIVNRRARFEYVLEEEFTAGLMLAGTEVKALRDGKANLSDAYAYVSEAGEVWIKNLHISEFKFGTYANHALKLYFTPRGWAKLDIALARGKKFYDKRATLKERDIDRDAARE